MPTGLQFLLHARRDVVRVDPSTREEAIGLVPVIQRGAEDDDAESVLDVDHPRARLRKRRDARASNGPRNGHAHAEYERQCKRRRGARRIEVAREQDDLNDDRRHACTREQRRNAAHGERKGHRPLAATRLDAVRVGREVDVDHVEHRHAQQDEKYSDAQVEPR